jgi:hypothetical protein
VRGFARLFQIAVSEHDIADVATRLHIMLGDLAELRAYDLSEIDSAIRLTTEGRR